MLNSGNIHFDDDRKTYVMGIVNATEDSFSDGGLFLKADAAIDHAMGLIKDGADIIDIGAESTRPGFKVVSADEELSRLIPIIKGLKERTDVPISIDTYKSVVAREVLKEGVALINDISFVSDEKMPELIASHGCAYCLMHNVNNVSDGNQSNIIENLDGEAADDAYVTRFMKECEDKADMLVKAGALRQQIIIDPGIGFNKNYQQNLRLTKELGKLRKLGYETLLGVSRKSIIGNALGLPTDQRLEGTLALTALAVLSDCRIVRVHDVKENVRVIRMLEAVMASS